MIHLGVLLLVLMRLPLLLPMWLWGGRRILLRGRMLLILGLRCLVMRRWLVMVLLRVLLRICAI